MFSRSEDSRSNYMAIASRMLYSESRQAYLHISFIEKRFKTAYPWSFLLQMQKLRRLFAYPWESIADLQ